MPKKHTPAYSKTKPSYVHPSLQSSRAPALSPAEPQTVNQRIAQLRREQAPRPTSEQRDALTSVVSSRTVPPNLRRILHIPEVNSPKPKRGTRMRAQAADGRRPPPGPPPPQSWLAQSRHAPPTETAINDSPTYLARSCLLAQTTEKDRQHPISLRSLQHQCLKTFAVNFEELVEYEQHYLAPLPTAFKETLLSYLTLYAPRGILDYQSFKILYQDDNGKELPGGEVRFIDLTGLLNSNFTIENLGRCIKPQHRQYVSEMALLKLGEKKPDNKGKGKASAADEVAETWEDEIDDDGPVQPIPFNSLRTPHFKNLTRLSLGHPGSFASWSELLGISPNLNKLTHLSLAYWPRPTLTPNAVASSMVSRYGSQSLSGTSFYAELDDDWYEACNLLRRFSINTYSLEWLDLEGCTWLEALSVGMERPILPPTPVAQGSSSRGASSSANSWRGDLTPAGPDWKDAWERVNYINVFQGWIPNDTKSLQNMPAGVIPARLMRWLREHENDPDVQWKLDSQLSPHAVKEWVEREKTSRHVCTQIWMSTRNSGPKYMQFDYGWGK